MSPMRIINRWLDRKDRATASAAARTLGQIGRDMKAKRAATLDELRGCVERKEIAQLGWRA